MVVGNITVEDFKNSAGTELGPSSWLLVDQDRIDLFADATDDHQFIHVDPRKAANTPYGGTIAHGFLSLSLVAPLVREIMLIPEGITMGINYGANKLRFIQPVKAGSRLRARATINRVSARSGGQFLVRFTVIVEIENEKRPALTAELISLYIVGESS